MKSLFCAALLSPFMLAAADVFVDCSYSGGDGDGSRERPYRNFSDFTIGYANTIRIAPGKYDVPQGLKASPQYVKIIGESGNPADTVLDGGGVADPIVNLVHGWVVSGVTLTNAVRGVRLEGGMVTNCVIDGCRLANQPETGGQCYGAGVWCKGGGVRSTVVRNCTVELSGAHSSHAAGAGIFVDCSANVGEIAFEDVTITNCAVLAQSSGGGNSRVLGAAGVYALNNGSRVALRRCRIVGNRVVNEMSDWGSYAGNAFHLTDNSSLTECEISGNIGVTIGYASRATVSNCIFRLNDPHYNDQTGFKFEGNCEISGCLFEANTNRSNNGGMLTLKGACSLRNSVLLNNVTTGSKHAGVYLDAANGAVVENCLIEGGRCLWMGGAISGGSIESARIIDCRIRDCSATSEGSAFYVGLKSGAGDGLLVRNCLIENCSLGRSVVHVSGATAERQVRFESCTFAGNASSGNFFKVNDGDGVSLLNCLLAGSDVPNGMGREIRDGEHSLDLTWLQAKLEDPLAGKYRPRSNSPAASGGAVQPWMAEADDFGELGFSRLPVGVEIVRTDAKPLLRDGLAPIGCFRALKSNGFMLLLR